MEATESGLNLIVDGALGAKRPVGRGCAPSSGFWNWNPGPFSSAQGPSASTAGDLWAWVPQVSTGGQKGSEIGSDRPPVDNPGQVSQAQGPTPAVRCIRLGSGRRCPAGKR